MFEDLFDKARNNMTQDSACDPAAEELTKDTKVRLSQIKDLGCTKDAKYKPGDISQKTGLQKQNDGTWAPPKETKFGIAKQENGQWGVRTKAGRNSEFIQHKNEADAKKALANYTAGYNTTERSKEDPHSDRSRLYKKWDKDTDKIRKENRAERRAEHASHFKNESKPASENRSAAYKRGEQIAEPAAERQKKGYASWASVLSGYDDESLIKQRESLKESVDDFENDINRYDKNSLASAVYKKRIDQQNWSIGGIKAIDEEIKARGLGKESKSASNSAPAAENKNMNESQKKEAEAYKKNKEFADFYKNTGLKGGYEEALARGMVEKEERKQDNLKAGKRDDNMFKTSDKVEFSRSGKFLNGKIEKVDKDYRGQVSLYVRSDDGRGFWVETDNITKHEPGAE